MGVRRVETSFIRESSDGVEDVESTDEDAELKEERAPRSLEVEGVVDGDADVGVGVGAGVGTTDFSFCEVVTVGLTFCQRRGVSSSRESRERSYCKFLFNSLQFCLDFSTSSQCDSHL